MTYRADLPPVTRKFNTQIASALDLDNVDPATASAIRTLSTLFLNALAELENDLIINTRSRHAYSSLRWHLSPWESSPASPPSRRAGEDLLD